MEEHARKLEGRKGSYYPIKCDMSGENDILNSFAYIKENHGPVHVLLNNAGKANLATLIDGDTNLWRDVLNVNVLGEYRKRFLSLFPRTNVLKRP